MIKSIEFRNFRNLNKKYFFKSNFNFIVGKNNSGKTNLLEGIKLAFGTISMEYVKVQKSDFRNSDDSQPIEIIVELETDSIPTFNFPDETGTDKCGFKLIIKKTPAGKYARKIVLLNGSPIDNEYWQNDKKVPNIYTVPLLRIEDVFAAGLTTGIENFIESEEKYKSIKEESKESIKKVMKKKIEEFENLCCKFNENMKIELTDPKIINEKLYIVDGKCEHNFRIGSGYKSIANIFLNTLDENLNIILIDEFENHLHPALIRNFIRELRKISNTFIISTTHSSVVINELEMKEIIDISSKRLDSIDKNNLSKLNKFLHPGRNELIMADNIVLVEGYTEELLLNYYLKKFNNNWTIVNVAGVMFEPYVELAVLLEKKCIVISDTDISTTDNMSKSDRFNNLSKLCKEKNIKLFETENTLETDLYNNGYLNNQKDLLKAHDKHSSIMVSKEKKKTEIIENIINEGVDLSDWHIIKDIRNEL